MTGDRPFHLIGVGPWGHDVVGHLVARMPAAAVTLLALDSSPADLDLPPALARILAADRPVPRLAAAIDDAAYDSGSPWFSVVIAHPFLQIGPAVAPGRGACYGCWQRRQRQHAAAPDVDSALERHYDEHPTAHLAGHLAPSAPLAVAMAGRVVDRLVSTPDAEAGWLRQINLVSQYMAKGRGVGVHGCQRCGLGRREPGRSHERLSAAMGQALGWTS